MSASLAAVVVTVCTSPESTSTPMCAFIPKYHCSPFLVWCISGSRSPSAFLVELGAKVEHPFRVIMRQFGLMKVRFRGLAKNTAHLITLFALSNLWMARRKLIAKMAALRPQTAR
jgi:hypothetical protein